MNLKFKGAKFRNNVKKFQIAVPELNVGNTPDEDPVVEIQESQVEKAQEKNGRTSLVDGRIIKRQNNFIIC